MNTAFSLQAPFEDLHRTAWETYLGHFTASIFGPSDRFPPSAQADIALEGLARAAARWSAAPQRRAPRRRVSTWVARTKAAQARGLDTLREDLVDSFCTACHDYFISFGKQHPLPAELASVQHILQLRCAFEGAAQAFREHWPVETTLHALQQMLQEAQWPQGEDLRISR
jgi:hypothetical protein